MNKKKLTAANFKQNFKRRQLEESDWLKYDKLTRKLDLEPLVQPLFDGTYKHEDIESKFGCFQ